MEYMNTSFTEAPIWTPLTAPDDVQTFLPYRVLGVVAATFATFILYMGYTPGVSRKSPEFTKDTVPFLGSWRFFDQKWSFWRDSVAASKTGNFSFWLGKYHVVGVSGEAARKMYLEHRDLDFLHGNVSLLGLGPDYELPLNKIFDQGYHHGRSYFQKRLVDLTKTEQLNSRLPRLLRDGHEAVEALSKGNGVVNPFTSVYPTVLKMSCRAVMTDDIADSPEIFNRLYAVLTELVGVSSRHNVVLPWIPSPSFVKRWYGRRQLHSIMKSVVTERIKQGTNDKDDALQLFFANGDPVEWIIRFLVSISFISIANAGILAGVLLNIVAHSATWQEKIYQDIKTAARTYSKNKDASLVEQLDDLPFEAWENAFPAIDLCFKEAIRMNTAFPMFRKNVSANSISIPGTGEIIPGYSYASYNTTDVHYNEELYPNPYKFDPDRYREGRKEFENQVFGFVGWGHGRHPCLGMRYAKLQQNILLAYAVARFEWSPCDVDGRPTPPQEPHINLDAAAPGLPQGIYVKHTPRS